MTFVYNHAKYMIGSGDIVIADADWRMLIVMSDTSAGSEVDVQSLTDFSNLDEADGTNYARQTLTGLVWIEDPSNNLSYLGANNPTWSALGVGSRQYVAIILFTHVSSDADATPVVYIDQTGFPFDGFGIDYKPTISTTAGILDLI